MRVIPCEVYSRIVGYLRPISGWNRGKRQEFRDRKDYQVSQTGPIQGNPEPEKLTVKRVMAELFD